MGNLRPLSVCSRLDRQEQLNYVRNCGECSTEDAEEQDDTERQCIASG
jgi:hypothetical protein